MGISIKADLYFKGGSFSWILKLKNLNNKWMKK